MLEHALDVFCENEGLLGRQWMAVFSEEDDAGHVRQALVFVEQAMSLSDSNGQ
ncbi:MAG TPA: hypothetical protein VGL99_24655 [Chloroflexota bacterium]